MQTPSASVTKPADRLPRPLALTPGEDLKGYVFSHVGKAALFLITCSSVLAVLLILVFVVREGIPFINVNTGYSDNAEVIEFGKAENDVVRGAYDVAVTISGGEVVGAQIKRANESAYHDAKIDGSVIKISQRPGSGTELAWAGSGMEIDVNVRAESGRAIEDGVYKSRVTVRSALSQFLMSPQWYPEARPVRFGALALISGSAYVTIAALVFAVPIGIMAAVFLSDIVPYRIGSIIKPVIELLAAIPSVAYGFFAVLVVAPLLQKKLGFPTGTNALNASLLLAVMALPTIISVAEDSLSALGRELREASYSLGATRLETSIRVVIPAAHSGIIAAIVLGMMRAIGETMVVWMASGNAAQIPHPWWDLSQSVRTMTATIAGDMGETAKGSPHYRSLFAVGIVLLVLTFSLNIVSEYFMMRAKKATGKS